MNDKVESVPTDPPVSTISSRDRILQAAKNLFATRGYENTSTVNIARAAGTSESQLMKHFGSKEGILEAIFDEAWVKINGSLRRAIQEADSPSQKLTALGSMVISALERDADVKLLLLLEGRRVRKEGHAVALSRGYLDFIGLVDGVLGEMRAAGQLRSDLHPQAVRSALVGALEGLLRDQVVALRGEFPAQYGSKELRQVFYTAASSVLMGGAVPAAGPPLRPAKSARTRNPNTKRHSESGSPPAV
jgi:AcrR family transcriptional regulator